MFNSDRGESELVETWQRFVQALLGVLALLVVIFLPSGNLIQEVLSIVPIILRPLIILLGLLVSVIQAFVFMLLSMIYLGQAVAHEH